MDFRIQLADFQGPLDLLLFLVKREEVDIRDMPIAMIAEQYTAHLEILEDLDINEVGDFLELASMLLEIKSQLILPRGDDEAESFDDPRDELVARLLEYKKYKDAASLLEDQSRDWQQHYSRLAGDLPPRQLDPAGQPIHEVELWDLVSAMGRVLRESKAAKPQAIVYDDTPIEVHMQRIQRELAAARQVAFSELFEPGLHKSAIVGVFLAVLELVRHHRVEATQPNLHGEIWIVPGADFDPSRPIETFAAEGDTPPRGEAN